MPAAYTSMPSVQVLDFEVIGLLIRHDRLLCDSYSSGQRFACGFLQIPPHGEHPCRPANSSPCRVCRGLAPPSECALPGAPIKKAEMLILCLTTIHLSSDYPVEALKVSLFFIRAKLLPSLLIY